MTTDEIPKHIGCYIAKKYIGSYDKKEHIKFICVKKARKQELQYDIKKLLMQFIMGQARELSKAKLGYNKLN